jgi:hypothetical protein
VFMQRAQIGELSLNKNKFGAGGHLTGTK